MTGRAVTDLYDMPSLGFKGEILVKCGHAVYPRHADAQHIRHQRHVLLAQVILRRLDLLQNGDEPGAVAAVGADDRFRSLPLWFHTISS